MKNMKTKFLHEGKYVAEVQVELLEAKDEWAPYLSVKDAYKLDEIREYLRKGDLKSAAKHAKVYALTPIAV